MNIPICVLTCDAYLWMLRPFAFLFNTFWGKEQEVTIFGYKPIFRVLNDLPQNFKFISIDKESYPERRWSDGLIKMIHLLKSPYFILFLEDFWLTAPVDIGVVDKLYEYMKVHHNVLRMDLTNERISKKNVKLIEHYDGIGIIEAPNSSKFSMSFQVGIWDSELALQVLREGETPWQTELQGTERINSLNGEIRVLGSDRRPVEYQPVYRKHRRRMTTDKIPSHLLEVIVERGWLRKRI